MPEDNLKFHRSLMDYVTYFEKLNRRSVALLDKVAAPGIYFKDPFNEVSDIEAMKHIFTHMFETLDAPKFKVTDKAWGKGGDTAYLRWTFTFARKGNQHSINGMSEIMFGADGKVISHIDHWDAGENVYEKIPLFGGLIAFIKSKLAAA